MPDEIRPAEEPTGRWLRLLTQEEFARLMGAAIERALIERGELDLGRARLLRWDALRRFTGLLRARTRRVRGVSREDFLRELERTHGSLLRDRQRYRSELATLEEQVRAARTARPAQGLARAQADELDARLRADLEGLLGATDRTSALEGVLQRERERRERALAQALAHERERVDVLERRLTKLRASLAVMERDLAELARKAELDPGVPSIYREVQGMSAEESEREHKVELLTRIFEQNLALQKRQA